MIEVLYACRLGNNLFQYCLGRILAEELGYALEVKPLEGFPNTSEAVEGERHSEPVHLMTGQTVPLRDMLADRSPRRIVLSGYFQDSSLYRPYRDRILKWLAFDTERRDATPRPALVLHVRRTDYLLSGSALPFSFYEQAIEQAAPDGEIWIATDDPHDPFFRRFRRWKPRIVSGSIVEDLRLMGSARTLILSASSFAWWAAFLAPEEQRVICPRPSFGIWAPDPEGPKLVDEENFTCIDVTETYRPTLVERAYQWWRLFRRPMDHEVILGFSSFSGSLKWAWAMCRQ